MVPLRGCSFERKHAKIIALHFQEIAPPRRKATNGLPPEKSAKSFPRMQNAPIQYADMCEMTFC
jgi:hypothetical protein